MRYQHAMTRSGLAVFALLVLGGVLWLVVIWPTPTTRVPHADVATSSYIGRVGQAGVPAALGPQPTAATPNAPAHPSAAVSVSTSQPAAADAHRASPTPPATVQLFAEPHGPVDEYKQRFEDEPRDSAASEAETSIRAAFAPEQASTPLFRTVLCRQTICRVELHWSAPALGPYVAAMGRMSAGFDRVFAISPGPLEADQTRSIELYVKRGATPR